MPGWLTKATQVFRRARVDVPFAVTSSAGKVVEGLRGDTHQVVRCPSTGEKLFVLPVDAYPAPRNAPAAKSKPKAKSKKPSKTEEPSRESASEQREAAAERPVTRPRPRRRGLSRIRERAAAARTWFTPLRTLGLGVVLVIGVTLWWTARSRARADAEIVLRTATREGWEALAAGDIETADDRFQAVIGALDTLGTDDPEMRRVAAETHVVTELSNLSLLAVLDDAGDFPDRHHGRWMIFDSAVVRASDANGNALVYVEFPFEIEGEPVDVIADPALFAGLEVPTEDSGATLDVIFAARLDALEPGDGPFPRWRLTLESETGFVWTHSATLAATGLGGGGLRDGETVDEILDRQARAMGVER